MFKCNARLMAKRAPLPDRVNAKARPLLQINYCEFTCSKGGGKSAGQMKYDFDFIDKLS
jgi:hypothetical protein